MTTTPSGPVPEPSAPDREQPSTDTRFFGHPLALGAVFSVELWERFSFYGMQFVMAVYLIRSLAEGGLGLPAASGANIIGAYGAMTYLAAVGGGWVADRLLGAERTLFYGAVVVMCGHLALAVLPGLGGVAVGLVLVALGAGGIKTSSTTVVGSLYDRNDPRCDAGFSIFYMGINIGALVGPALTGIVQEGLGSFHLAFGLAAVGMAVGLTVYTLGRRTLPAAARTVPDPAPRAAVVRVAAIVVVLAALVVLGFALGLLRPDNLSDAIAYVVGAAAIAIFVVLLTSPKVDDDERSRVWAFVPLWIGSLVFWSLFQQQFTSVVLYVEERTDRGLFGWEVPTASAGSIEPFFVVVLAPLFALLWTKLGDRAPSTPIKFALGAGGMGVAFLLFLPWSGGTGPTTPLAVVALVLLVFALAELNISPIGLSASTRLAPAAHRNLMVPLFYLTISLGSALAGKLAEYSTSIGEATYFGTVGGIAIVLAVVLAALSPIVNRAMRGVR